MAKKTVTNGNTYEEARKLRLEENKKRIEDLGILRLAKNSSKPTDSETRSKQRLPKPKPENSEAFEPRRSSRARNPVSYLDEIDIDKPVLGKRSRSRSNSSPRDRSRGEISYATSEEVEQAKRAAEEFQENLQSGKPSFFKQMLWSNVCKGFWLALPSKFCKKHLPKEDVEVILEDESGANSNTKFLAEKGKGGFSGGWKGFAVDHKLKEGDALVFELVEQWKFKVYTFRVSKSNPIEERVQIVDKVGSTYLKRASKRDKKLDLKPTRAQKKNGAQIQKEAKKTNASKDGGISGGTLHEEANAEMVKDQSVVKPKKKRAEKLFRKKVIKSCGSRFRV